MPNDPDEEDLDQLSSLTPDNDSEIDGEAEKQEQQHEVQRGTDQEDQAKGDDASDADAEQERTVDLNPEETD